MTIKEVQQKYCISGDTLRYYERVGMIPPVTRTAGGVRNYTKEDLSWVELVLCMRNAGLKIEAIIQYVQLFQQGDATLEARLNLLQQQREALLEQRQKINTMLERLNHKIERYEQAVKTGTLSWEPAKN